MQFRDKLYFFSVFLVLLFYNLKEIHGQCSSIISTFPYLEDFETGNGGWTSGGLSDDWQLGTPAKSTINSAGNGTQSWISGGPAISFYNYGERSWVMSPCFDLSSLNYPIVSLKVFWELESQYDGGNLQYSTDGGTSWRTIGSSSETNNCVNENWYNTRSITNLSGLGNSASGWSGTIQPSNGSCRGGNGQGDWVDAKHCISELKGEPSVKFRFTMGSGTTCNDYDGIAFDYFQIYESEEQAFSISKNCLSSGQIQFSDDKTDCHDYWKWNFGDAASGLNTSSVSSPTHQFSGPGIYTVTLESGSSCIPPYTSGITIEILNIETNSSNVTCAGGNDGEANVIVTNPPAGISYSWNSDPVQTTSIAKDLEVGNYIVSINSPNNCEQRANIEVRYGPFAFPIVSLGNDTVLCPGNQLILYPGNYAEYEWQDGSNDSIFTAISGGIISIKIKNEFGCVGSDSVIVEEDCLGDILFPNAFSPNGDGLNEIFYTIGNLVTSYELSIFDRWGQLIFKSLDPMEGWALDQSGRLYENGIYVIKVNYSIRGGVARQKTGKITLLR